MNQNSTLDSAGSGMIIPVGDSRYPSPNIRLSAALCALGFMVHHDCEPCSVTIDAETHKRVVTFWHTPVAPEGSPLFGHKQNPKAIDIDAWWRSPGKYTLEGFDDALQAMRCVLEEREWLLGVLHGSQQLQRPTSRFSREGEVKTDDLHFASVIKAAGVPLVAFERKDRRGPGIFIFPKQAIPIAELIAQEARPNSSVAQRGTVTKHGRDLCIDWMLWALRYRDWLHRMVRNPDCIPVFEFRDEAHDRCAIMSAQLDERKQNELLSYL